MKPSSARTPTALPASLVVSGYGVRIAVERGHLLVSDGLAGRRRNLRVSRVDGLRRLVLLGHAGTLSIEAVRWLADVGAALVQLGPDGDVLATSGPPGLDDVRVRRGQALAPYTGAALTVARELLGAKLDGQRSVLANLPGARETEAELRRWRGRLDAAETVEQARHAESRAAAAYWQAWAAVPIPFAPKDARRVPAHWRTFGTRSSLLATSPRKAVNPGNALLNYLYAIVEAEARLACLAVGLDTGLGVIHTDKQGRDSFALDLMEAVRPAVDAYVLRLLRTRPLLASDVFETREGVCRLLPPLTEPLASTGPQWAALLGAHAERAAARFLAAGRPADARLTPAPERPSPTGPVRYRTPLTQSNRRAEGAEGAEQAPALPRVRAPLENRCRSCGAGLGARKRTLCDECLPAHAAESVKRAQTVQRQLQLVGEDGRSSAATRAKHRADALRQAQRNREWEAAQAQIPGPAVFRDEIWPLLRDVRPEAVAAATGLVRRTCTLICTGRIVPHARHWDALRALTRDPAARCTRIPPEYRDAPASHFLDAILPGLSAVAVERIQRATGLSRSYARRIKAGHHVPDRRHWGALRKLLA